MFTLLRWLELGLGRPASEIIKLVDAGGDASPEFRVLADAWLAELSKARSEENVQTLREAITQEVADIKSGKINQREHASDY